MQCLFIDYIISPALPPGAKKYTSTDPVAKEIIKQAWAGLSEAEKASVSAEYMKELEEEKEIRQTGKQNSTVAAFHDVRRTLAKLYEEVREL